MLTGETLTGETLPGETLTAETAQELEEELAAGRSVNGRPANANAGAERGRTGVQRAAAAAAAAAAAEGGRRAQFAARAAAARATVVRADPHAQVGGLR